MQRIAVPPGAATAALLLLVCSIPSWSPVIAAGPTGFTVCAPGIDSGEETARRADPGDIHVFDPYIGRFRTGTKEASGKPFHYVAEYAWFDANRSIVRFTISTVDETSRAETVNGQGFYGYDPFNERLYVLGVFTSGITGFGCVGEFDHKTNRRVTWAWSRGADGTTTHVRDAFELVDRNTWKDVTSIRKGTDGEWKVVYEDTFSRIEE